MRTPFVLDLDPGRTTIAAASCDVTGAQRASTRRFDRGPDAPIAFAAAAEPSTTSV